MIFTPEEIDWILTFLYGKALRPLLCHCSRAITTHPHQNQPTPMMMQSTLYALLTAAACVAPAFADNRSRQQRPPVAGFDPRRAGLAPAASFGQWRIHGFEGAAGWARSRDAGTSQGDREVADFSGVTHVFRGGHVGNGALLVDSRRVHTRRRQFFLTRG